MDETRIIAETRAWVDRAVIGLNLCPFAKSVQVKGQVRYVCSPATDTDALLNTLIDELQTLAAADPQQIDTTLLVHPQVLQDFADYNDFLDVADAMLDEEDLAGVLQVASFHPQYRFADAPDDDVAHCTNRSPYPMLHLLREASIARAVAAYPDAAQIYERNIARLRELGWAGWQQLLTPPG